MASVECRNEKYRVVFMYAGRKYSYALDTRDPDTAQALRGGVEKTLMLLDQSALRIPAGADVVEFVKNGGKVEEPAAPPPEPLSFKRLTDAYLAAHGVGSIEANSRDTIRMHLAHFTATLGGALPCPAAHPGRPAAPRGPLGLRRGERDPEEPPGGALGAKKN